MDTSIAPFNVLRPRLAWYCAFLLASTLLCQTTYAATLADLFAGGTLDAGNARFSSWQLASLDVTGGLNPNFALVSVTPIASDPANPGLQFALSNQLTTSGLNAIDLNFSYRIQAKTGGASFVGHTLNLGAVAFGGSGGVAVVSQNVVLPSGVDGGSAVAFADNGNGVSQPIAVAIHAPLLSATVNVNIFLQGTSGGDSIAPAGFTQRFTQTGLMPIAGDFNSDLTIDGADFLAWQRNAPPGVLTQANLTAWRTSYGQSVATNPTVSAVPEPNAAIIVLTTLAVPPFFRLPIGGKSIILVKQNAR